MRKKRESVADAKISAREYCVWRC